MAGGIDGSTEIQNPRTQTDLDQDVFQVAGLYAEGQKPVNHIEGQPIPKGREVLFSITSKDGIAGGDQRTYGMHIPENFDPAKPTRLIIAAHGTIGGSKNAADSIMEHELDPEGHALHNTVNDNVVYVDPIGKNEVVNTILGKTQVQSWRTPGSNLLPDEGKPYPNDLQYVHDVIADAEQKIKTMGSSVYMKQAFGFSDGGRMVREYNCAYPGELSYVESDHGTSLGNDKQCAAQAPTTIVESGPTYDFPIPPGGTFDAITPAVPMLGIGDRMLPPEGGVGEVSVLFNTPGFSHSQPMRQVDEARAANQCVGEPQVTSGNGQEGHEKNAIETTWKNCPGGYVKLIQEYLDPEHKLASSHAVNDTHYGTGGMPVVGSRVDNNEVSAFWRRSDEIARQKLPASEAKPVTPDHVSVQHG